jgi:hypothetical protein
MVGAAGGQAELEYLLRVNLRRGRRFAPSCVAAALRGLRVKSRDPQTEGEQRRLAGREAAQRNALRAYGFLSELKPACRQAGSDPLRRSDGNARQVPRVETATDEAAGVEVGRRATTCCKRSGASERASRGLVLTELKLRPPERQGRRFAPSCFRRGRPSQAQGKKPRPTKRIEWKSSGERRLAAREAAQRNVLRANWICRS